MNDLKFVEVSEEEFEKEVGDILEKKVAEQPVDQDISKANVSSVQDLPEDPDQMRNALQGKKPYSAADANAQVMYHKAHEAIIRYSEEENADALPVTDEEGFDEDFLEMIEQETVEPGQIEPPHVISFAEFYNERPEYDKVTIEWYEPDDTFIDENEELIPEPESYVGMKVKDLFGLPTADGDPDIRFVRNEKYGSDYEIVRHHRSWVETIGGGE